MSKLTKWIIAICCLIIIFCFGGYFGLIWAQGIVFDHEANIKEVEINGVIVRTKIDITQKSFFTRQFTLATEIQDTPLINHEGIVTFGWDPVAQLRATSVPADANLEKAVLAAKPHLTANFNVRFWPIKVYGGMDPMTVNTDIGEVQVGQTNVVADITYFSHWFSQKAEVNAIDIKYESESFKQKDASFGESKLFATIWPKQQKILKMDISFLNGVFPQADLKADSFLFQTDLSQKGSDYVETFLIKSSGTESFTNKPVPYTVLNDVKAQWPQKINFLGLVAAMMTGGQTRIEVTDRDIKEFVKALREGKASILINDIAITAQGITVKANGEIGDTKGQGVWSQMQLRAKTQDLSQLGLLLALIPKDAIDQQTHEVIANIEVKEANEMLQILVNGQSVYELPAKSILKELY